MRFVLCVVVAALLPAPALAAKGGGSMSLSHAQAAAAERRCGGRGSARDHDRPRKLHDRVRQPRPLEKPVRQRLPPGPVSSGRGAAVLRVEVGARRGSGDGQGTIMSELRFPNESRAYRDARDALLKDEKELLDKVKAVAAKRRQLPDG